MTKTDFINAVAEYSRIEDIEMLSAMSQRELADKVIFARILGVARGNFRYNRITGNYMQFVADYGQYCIEADRESGELMMEFALQRLSKGAVVHKGVHLINILPENYRKYTAAYDEPGLMGTKCWAFITKNLVFCIRNLSNASYRSHAEVILWGLLDHLNPDGSTNDGYMWNNPQYVGVTEAEAYEWVERAAVGCFGIDAIAQYFALDWRKHKAFLRHNEKVIDWDAFFSHINLDAENFYTGIVGSIYRLIGIYSKMTMKAIREEISAR